MKLLLTLLRYSPTVVLVTSFIGLLGGAAGTVLIALINTRLQRGELSWAHAGLWFIGLVLGTMVANVVTRLLMIRLSQRTIFDLRRDLCLQTLHTPLDQLEEIGSNRVLAALTQDVETITGALLNVTTLCINASILIGCMIYMGLLSWKALLSLLAFMVLAYLTYAIPERYARRYLARAREAWDRMVEHYRSMLGGMKELKLHRARRRAFTFELLDPTAEDLRGSYVTATQTYALVNGWSQILYFLFIGAVLFLLANFFALGTEVLTGYVLIALYLRGPIGALLEVIPSFGGALVARRKIEELGVSLASKTASAEAAALEATLPAPSPCRRLELRGLTHHYHQQGSEHPFSLGPIDFSFEAGTITFIVGGNGSGKTTLAKLVTALYTQEGGEIRLDGTVIDGDKREWYRQHFSAIFSDFHLFDCLLGIESGPELEARVATYLKRLELERVVGVEEGRLTSLNLSQGQRKRLALLTAYLEDRPIYLFDEWAADQDPIFKQTFYHELLPELKARGKMVLVISHDDRYYSLADRMLKLESGRQVEVPREAEKVAVKEAVR